MSPREIIDEAMARAELDLEQLAERLGKKIRTMKAIRSGEIPLAEDVKLHIKDLVALSEMRRSKQGKLGGKSRKAVDYTEGPRGPLQTRRLDLPEDRLREDQAHSAGGYERASGGSGMTSLTARTIPLISWAQAGELPDWDGLYDHAEIVAYNCKDPKALAVTVRGDAMEPDYKDGTIAVVYPSSQAKNGDLVLARLSDGSVLFKRLQINGGQLTFISLNPVYPPIVVERSKVERLAPVGITQRLEL